MSSVSGIKDGDFDRLSIVQDLGVGQDRNFGTNGQVLTSGGEGQSLFWGTNSATLPQGLVAGTNITFTPSGTFNGSVETTISATDTGTTYTGVEPIVVDNTDDVIGLDFGETLTVDTNDNLAVVKVPNAITFVTDGTGSRTGTFDGSGAIIIDNRDSDTTYTAGNGIQISGSNQIQTRTDNDTIVDNFGTGGGANNKLHVVKVPNSITFATDGSGSRTGTFDGSGAITIDNRDSDTTYTATAPIDITSEVISLNKDATLTTITNNLSVVKVPNTLTITDSAGTSVIYDGSSAETITINDNDTTYQGGTGISIDTTTNPDTINCSAIPNSALANSTISGISLGSNLANLTAGTNISFDVGTTYNGSTAITISAQDTDTGITDLNEGDGINITDVSATEKTISANIDTNTLEFKTDTLGAPEPKEIAVKKLPHTLTITDSAGQSVVFDGDVDKSITINDNNTEYTGTAPIDVNNTTDVISLNKDSTLTTISNNLSVVKVPNALTITKTDGTDVVFDGTSAESITLTTDTGITTLNGGDGITITDVSATEKTVSVDNETSTLGFNASKQLKVLKVPNDLLTECQMLNFRSSTSYNGVAQRKLYINTQVRRREVHPTTNATYDIYRRIKATGYPISSDTMYPFDTGFNLTSIPNIRPSGFTIPYGYKVTISFTMLVDTATNSGDNVYVRIDSSNNYISGWGKPVFICGGQDSGGSNQGHHRHHATFVVNTTSTTFDIYPVIAVYNKSGTNDSQNNTPRITYGAQFGNLVMDVTPLQVRSSTTTANPFTLSGGDDY